MLAGVTIILVALTFLPALALGPLAEGLLMTSDRSTVLPSSEPVSRTDGGRLTAQRSTTSPARRVGAGRLDPKLLWRSLPDALRKLDPRTLWRNPVMFVVEIGSDLHHRARGAPTQPVRLGDHDLALADCAVREPRGGGGARVAARRRRRRCAAPARRPLPVGCCDWSPGAASVDEEAVPANALQLGDVVVVEAGQVIPGDGDVVEGIAMVDESVITGESAPVIRESGGDRSAVTGGTRVLSDRIVVRITQQPGESFIDRMIALVEGANRQKTPNEIALNILLAALTILFLLAVATLQPLAIYSKQVQAAAPDSAVLNNQRRHGDRARIAAGLPDSRRRSARCCRPSASRAWIGSCSAMCLAMSGRAVEAAGDVNTLLLDKTGTITLGNRQASEFLPVGDADEVELADAAQLSSLADETPEGRSVVVLAKERYGLRARQPGELAAATWVPFSAQTRMSGVDLPARETDGAAVRVRKGAAAAVLAWVRENGGGPSNGVGPIVDGISAAGGTPLVVAAQRHGEPARALGVIYLKDVVKTGMSERFDEMRRMGIRTVMITGDNPLTARTIAAEAGVDDFLAEATPEDKMALIKAEQQGGKLVAMTGRRHQRRPRIGASRCWRRNEHRHLGRQGSREHGRPRLRSHQAHRDRRDRQTAADHPRCADHVLHRQRHREVLRDHPRDVRRGLSQSRPAQHHAAA